MVKWPVKTIIANAVAFAERISPAGGKKGARRKKERRVRRRESRDDGESIGAGERGEGSDALASRGHYGILLAGAALSSLRSLAHDCPD